MRHSRVNSIIFILVLLVTKPLKAIDFDTGLYCVTAFNLVVGSITVSGIVKRIRTEKTAHQRKKIIDRYVVKGPVNDEIYRHAETELNFFREVERLENELPKGERELASQRKDLFELIERVESAPRESSLTYAEAQYLLALKMRLGTLAERREKSEKILEIIRKGAQASEADESLAIDVLFLALRIGDAKAKEKSIAELTVLAKGGVNHTNIRLKAMHKLAELEKHEYLNEIGDFAALKRQLIEGLPSLENRDLLQKTLLLWPNDKLLKWFAANGIPAKHDLDLRDDILQGRSPAFLLQAYHLDRKSRLRIIKTLSSIQTEKALLSLSSIVRFELEEAGNAGEQELVYLIKELGRRPELMALSILHQIESASDKQEIKLLARAEISKMIFPTQSGSTKAQTARNTPNGENIDFDAFIRQIAASRNEKSVSTLEVLLLHSDFARKENSAYLLAHHIEWIAEHAFKETRFPEDELIKMILKWSDKSIEGWIDGPGFERMTPEGRAKILDGCPIEYKLNLALQNRRIKAKCTAIEALKGSTDTRKLLTLNKIVSDATRPGGNRAAQRQIFESVIRSLEFDNHFKSLELLDRIDQNSPDLDIKVLAQREFFRIAFLPGTLIANRSIDLRSESQKLIELQGYLSLPSVNFQLLGAELLREISPGALSLPDSPFFTALKADTAAVRSQAVMSLSQKSDPEILELLSNVVKDEKQYTPVRMQALLALKTIGTAPARKIIAQARTLRSEPVRRVAVDYDKRTHPPIRTKQTRAMKDLSQFTEIPGFHDGFHKNATVVYYAPDASNFKDGKAMADAYERFERLLPLEQRLRNIYTDVLSSFKAYTAESLGEQKVLHVSVAGSEDLIDWLVNANHGTAQITNPAYAELKKEVVEWAKKNPLGRIDVTGHSLGGVAATAIGVELRTLAPEGAKVRVVTWNGLGAVQAMRRAGIYNAKSASELEIMNYRVHGDIVSRVGTPIGKHVTLPGFTRGILGAPARLMSMITQSAHYMDLANVIGVTTDSKTLAPPGNIWRFTPITAPLSFVIGFIPNDLRAGYYLLNEAHYLKKLEDADKIWQERRGKLDGPDAFRPFIREIEIIKARMATRKQFSINF